MIDAIPTVNAALNGTAALLLVAGWVLVRRKRVAAHRALMVSAFSLSAVFLVLYVVRVSIAGIRPFEGSGPVRGAYLALLGSHMVLAATVPPLAIITLLRGLRGRHPAHRTIARWTLPVWLYVSITGVAVHVMLELYRR